MRGVEDRLTFVEGRVREHAIMLGNLDRGLGGVREDMNRRFDDVNARLDRLDGRMDRMETHFEARFDRMDARFDRMDARFDLLEAKGSRQFVWLAGLLVMTLVAMVTTLAAAVLSSS